MRALHINWTKPYFLRKSGKYAVEDFEILTTILSALKWREKNGSIKMVTDSAGAAFYRENGMERLWDEGINEVLDDITADARMFWAAGKLYALRHERAPVAVIDTDFIVWESILFDTLPDLTAIHDEELYPDVYPDPAMFRMNEGYVLDDRWDMSLRALNTAFYVIKNQKLLEYYTDEAVRFMENAEAVGDPLTYMVFAEQRLLPMCAGRLGCSCGTFSDLHRLFANGDGWFTHTWGMKQQMRDNEQLREAFCRRCIGRILNDYPECEDMLRGIDELKGYFC